MPVYILAPPGPIGWMFIILMGIGFAIYVCWPDEDQREKWRKDRERNRQEYKANPPPPRQTLIPQRWSAVLFGLLLLFVWISTLAQHH